MSTLQSSSRDEEILDRPQTTIGCQDLLTVRGVSHQGFMRKQDALERLFKFLKWRTKYVVLSRGCIYIYKDELSRSPARAYSMKAFQKCQRLPTNQARWGFQVMPIELQTGKILMFACPTDNERKAWMRAIVLEMGKAHHLKTPPPTTAQLDDYVYLEAEVKPAAPERYSEVRKDLQHNNIPDEEEEDEETPYNVIDDHVLPEKTTPAEPRGRKKPNFTVEVPKDQVSVNRATSLASPVNKPKIATPSTPRSQTLPTQAKSPSSVSRQSFQFSGSDREEVEKLLKTHPDGTYLVRKSRSDNKEVLSVKINGELKEFKIHEKEGQVTIDHSIFFGSVEELLEHYTENNLPKKDSTLVRPYNQDLTQDGRGYENEEVVKQLKKSKKK